MNAPELRDRVVVVTGGGRGLGRDIAEAFARQGALVAISGRDPDTLSKTQDELSSSGGKVRGFVADVSDEAAMRSLRDAVEDAFGPADVLVNNAGVNPWFKRSEHTSIQEWRHIIDVDLTGVFIGCRLFGERMVQRGRGCIVNISSVAARTGLVRTAAYCASKGGVEAMTRSLAAEWARAGVRVNCVAPGYFETDLTAGLRANDGLSQNVLARTPMGRYGVQGEVSGACLYLASDAAAYVTGQSLAVDGGWTAA